MPGCRYATRRAARKQLVYALTKRRVKTGGLPIEKGVLVVNVGSCYALYRAIYEGTPLIDRVVTVGGCVQKPANYLVRIGTPVQWLLDASEGLLPQARMMIYGGPMMGLAINRTDIPVTKGCSGITVLEKALDAEAGKRMHPLRALRRGVPDAAVPVGYRQGRAQRPVR